MILMEKRIVMSKKEYTELIDATSSAVAFVTLMETVQRMIDNDELSLETLVITIAGITDNLAKEANELIEKYELSGVDKDSIIVLDTIAGGAK